MSTLGSDLRQALRSIPVRPQILALSLSLGMASAKEPQVTPAVLNSVQAYLEGTPSSLSRSLGHVFGGQLGGFPDALPGVLECGQLAPCHLSIYHLGLAEDDIRAADGLDHGLHVDHPPAIKMGMRRVLYRVTDLVAWIDARLEPVPRHR